MNRDKTTEPMIPQMIEEPKTMAEAQGMLASIRPARLAPLADWLVYHRHAAGLYTEIAEIDRDHHDECLAMAKHQRDCLASIKAKIAAQGLAGDQ